MAYRALGWAAVSSKPQTADDKFSLPEQRANIENVAAREGWHLVDILEVPGHSRRYIDFHKLKRDALEKGIDAFEKLERHWEAKDFDVLVVRDGDRFARKQSLHAYIVERTIDANAKIYILTNNSWIDETNYPMFTAMGGYQAASEVDKLVRNLRTSRRERVKRGLPNNNKTPFSHRVVRDSSGKGIGVEVCENTRGVFEDAAQLLLEGVGYRRIEGELFRRYKHVNPNTGKPWPAMHFHKVWFNPIFWGHVANRYYDLPNDMWLIEEGHPIPEESGINYNVHAPMYTGTLAASVKAELRRRMTQRGRGYSVKKFSGLVMCGSCGYTVTYRNKKFYGCVTNKLVRAGRMHGVECDSEKLVKETIIQQYVDDLLTRLLDDSMPTDEIFAVDVNQADRIARLQNERDDLESQVTRLIMLQAQAPENIRHLYDKQITIASERLSIVESDIEHLKTRSNTNRVQDRMTALNDLRQQSLSWFWEQDGLYINQQLRRIFGEYRLILLHREIVGIGHLNK